MADLKFEASGEGKSGMVFDFSGEEESTDSAETSSEAAEESSEDLASEASGDEEEIESEDGEENVLEPDEDEVFNLESDEDEEEEESEGESEDKPIPKKEFLARLSRQREKFEGKIEALKAEVESSKGPTDFEKTVFSLYEDFKDPAEAIRFDKGFMDGISDLRQAQLESGEFKGSPLETVLQQVESLKKGRPMPDKTTDLSRESKAPEKDPETQQVAQMMRQDKVSKTLEDYRIKQDLRGPLREKMASLLSETPLTELTGETLTDALKKAAKSYNWKPNEIQDPVKRTKKAEPKTGRSRGAIRSSAATPKDDKKKEESKDAPDNLKDWQSRNRETVIDMLGGRDAS